MAKAAETLESPEVFATSTGMRFSGRLLYACSIAFAKASGWDRYGACVQPGKDFLNRCFEYARTSPRLDVAE